MAELRTLFVTGASGFIGRQVIARVDRNTAGRVVALSRRGPPGGWFPLPGAPDIEWVRGDLATPGSWRDLLSGDAAVLHLAAASGAASPAELAAVNVDGTANLIRECAARGARRFVYVSSIAAAWPDDRYYPYAQTKRAAELLVSRSSLTWTIVRPAIVLGSGSPLWPRLRTLATLPVSLLIGGGTARIQPVLAGDLAAMLLACLGRDGVAGQTIEVGGPEVLTMADFLARARKVVTGEAGGRTRTVRLPYGMMRRALVAANTVLLGRSPVGPGQLTSFVTDGVAEPHPFTAEWLPRMSGIEAMIRESEARG